MTRTAHLGSIGCVTAYARDADGKTEPGYFEIGDDDVVRWRQGYPPAVKRSPMTGRVRPAETEGE